MHPYKLFFLHKFTLGFVLLALTVSTPAKAEEELTNVIPKDVFVTDPENTRLGLFVVRGTELSQKVIPVKLIKEARELPECRPADQDPEGSWGEPKYGMQLSLRFDKRTFAVGEPVMAKVFIRNVTNSNIRISAIYTSGMPSPIGVNARFGTNTLEYSLENVGNGEASLRSLPVQMQTQKKYPVNLSRYYKLTTPGDYFFQAEGTPVDSSPKGPVTSQFVKITIANPAAPTKPIANTNSIQK